MPEAVQHKPDNNLAERETFALALEDVAKNQSRKSFAVLFEFFAPRVKSFMKRLGCEDMEAEELAQEVMITVWRKAEQYDRSQASPSTWIFRIARNRRIDAFRREKRLDAQADEPALSPAALPHPEDVYDATETETRVRDAMKTLPDEQKSLLKAAFFEGLSHSEIANRTKLPLGTVKSRMRLAFQKLRTRLER